VIPTGTPCLNKSFPIAFATKPKAPENTRNKVEIVKPIKPEKARKLKVTIFEFVFSISTSIKF